MVLNHLLNEKTQGFYIDIGAFNPIFLSNTYYFYSRGWYGINVDATPGAIKTLKLCVHGILTLKHASVRQQRKALNFISLIEQR